MAAEQEKPRTTEVRVRMDCNGCVQKIKKALQGISGIYDLYIDFPQQKLTIIGWADPEKIVKAIRKTRKIATICSHSEQREPETKLPDQAAETSQHAPSEAANRPQAKSPPCEPASPPGEPANPPPETVPPAEQPKDPPAPEKPNPEPVPASTENRENANQPRHFGTKDVGEVHVVYHYPPDYGYRYGYGPRYYGHTYNGPSYDAHWNRYADGMGFPPEPQIQYSSIHRFQHEPPEGYVSSRKIYQHEPLDRYASTSQVYELGPPGRYARSQVFAHEPPNRYAANNQAVLHVDTPDRYVTHQEFLHEPPNRYAADNQGVRHVEAPNKYVHGQGFPHEPPNRYATNSQAVPSVEPPNRYVNSQGFPHEPSNRYAANNQGVPHVEPQNRYVNSPRFSTESPQPVYVNHNYSMHRPSPYVTEYEYVHSPPRRMYHIRRDHYSEEYPSSNNSNGNITAMFSDENPNACRIM